MTSLQNELDRAVEQALLDDDDLETAHNFNILAQPREGYRFVSVIEGDEMVEGFPLPPRPKTIEAATKAYLDLIVKHGPDDVIGVACFKDKPAGIKELNDAIRAAKGYGERVEPGDLLMITKNSRDRTVLNGERYRVIAVDTSGIVTARLIGADRTIRLEAKHHARGPCKNVDWGYFATIHKYQGSEADGCVVVIPSSTLKLMKAIDDQKEPWFFDRSCLYTACSRPKLSLVLVGDPNDIHGAMKLNCSNRLTALSRMFAEAASTIVPSPSPPKGSERRAKGCEV
jgi:ATP-dependent exoDNAse (exonuclease V) alpha subunit